MDKYSKYYLNSILSLKCPLYTYYVQNRFAEIDAISDVELKRFCSHEDAVNWLRSCALYDVFNMQNLRSFLTHQALSCYQIDRMDDHQVINEAAHLIINYPIVIEPQFKSSYLFFNGSRLYWIEENNLKSWQAVSGRKGYQSANFQNLKGSR